MSQKNYSNGECNSQNLNLIYVKFYKNFQLYILLLAYRWVYFTYSKLCLPRFIASDRTINAANVHDIVGAFPECRHGGGWPGGYEDTI